MIRSYALVVFDNQDSIIDRFNLNLVTNPTENGFKLTLSKVVTDIEDFITKVVQQKITKKFNVIQYGNPYQKSLILTDWIQKYSKPSYHMALEYDDTVQLRYCEGKVTALSKTEKDEYGVLTQALEFTPTTPYFIRRENVITITVSKEGKKYPYKYPYSYGSGIVKNNAIENPYLTSIPLTIIISGAISSPTVYLTDEKNQAYSRVRFSNFELLQNEKLIINSSQKKIYKETYSGGSVSSSVDFTSEVDPQYDTFLRAQSGKSIVQVNTSDASTGFSLIGHWRQYVL